MWDFKETPVLIQTADGLLTRAGENRLGNGFDLGYLADAVGKPVAIWAGYGQVSRKSERRIAKTFILSAPQPLGRIADLFPTLAARLADSASRIFAIQSPLCDELAVIIQDADDRPLLVRFQFDRIDRTLINVHSPFKSFTVSEMTPDARRQAAMASDERSGTQDGSWQRRDNLFESGLHFSEKLSRRPTTELIVVHHTKVENMTVASIHAMHLKNGWAGIGYHKVILPDGTVADGRPEPMIGAHAKGFNRRSIGISLVGDLDAAPPPPAQLAALGALTKQLMAKYGINADHVVGHRDVVKGTKCPGDKFPWTEFKALISR